MLKFIIVKNKIIIFIKHFYLVIDDEATTVYTAGAIVTVTVQLKRQDMKVLFGDESYADKHIELEKNVKESDKPNKMDKPLNDDEVENNDIEDDKEVKDNEKEKKVIKGIWQQKRQSGKGKKSGNVKKQKTTLSASAKKKIKKKEKLEKAKVCFRYNVL